MTVSLECTRSQLKSGVPTPQLLLYLKWTGGYVLLVPLCFSPILAFLMRLQSVIALLSDQLGSVSEFPLKDSAVRLYLRGMLSN